MSNSQDLSSLCDSRDTYMDPSDIRFDADNILSIYRASNILRFMLDKKNLNTEDYLVSLLPLLVPGLLLAFFVIMRALWSVFLIFRRKEMICLGFFKYLDTLFYSEKKKKRFLIAQGILTIMGIGVISAGIFFSVKLMINIDNSYCTYYSFLQKLNSGDSNKSWVGLSKGSTRISGINSLITSTASSMSQNTGGTSGFVRSYAALTTKSTTLTNKFDTIYQARKSQTITLPYFSVPESAYNPPLFQSLGPTSDKTTKLGAATSTIQDITTNLPIYNNGVDQTTSTFISSQSSYSTKFAVIDTALQNMAAWYSTFNSNNQATIKFSSVRFYLIIISFLIIGLFSITCLTSVIALIFLRLLYIDKIVQEAKLYRLLTFFTFGVLLLYAGIITIIYPITVMSLEICTLSATVLKDPSFFKDKFIYFDGMTTDSLDFLSYCIHGTGDLSKKYDVTSFFENYESYLTNVDGVITKGSISMNETPNLLNEANMYRYFYINADQYDSTRSSKISDKLKEVNKLSNFLEDGSIQLELSRCRILADTWVLSTAQCSSKTTVLSGGTEGTSNFGRRSCLGINEVTASGLINRLADYKFLGCGPMTGFGYSSGTLQTNLLTYLNHFVTHTQSVQTAYGNLATDLSNLENNELANYKTEVNNIKTPVVTLKASTNSMSKLVMPDNDLSTKKGLDCSSVKAASFQIQYNICQGLSYTSQIIAILAPVAFLFLGIQALIYSQLLIVTL